LAPHPISAVTIGFGRGPGRTGRTTSHLRPGKTICSRIPVGRRGPTHYCPAGGHGGLDDSLRDCCPQAGEFQGMASTQKDWNERRSGWQQQAEDRRSPSDVDYARIVHSGSFRRLQGKTQILNLGDSDFYRTRLTHSLEVAQIAGSIARQFDGIYASHPAHPHIPPLSLIQSAGFSHDLGHPPFGHGGEVALNYCMRDAGGFEGKRSRQRSLRPPQQRQVFRRAYRSLVP